MTASSSPSGVLKEGKVQVAQEPPSHQPTPFKSPLSGTSDDEVKRDVDDFVTKHQLDDLSGSFHKGGLLARAEAEGRSQDDLELLTPEEKNALVAEQKSPMKSIPLTMWLLCALCAGCAIVQGMDQTVINGAQEFYFAEFGITNTFMKGFINGSPYVAASTVGCFLNSTLNKHLGRRGTICVACLIAFVTAIWQAAANGWVNLLLARLTLGIAVGAKSSTTPVFAAESSPTRLRGTLTMLWQVFTAFGIMLGFAVSLVFQHVDFMGENSQWRWMVGVTAVPPLIVAVAVYFLPESPRWYMSREEYDKAWQSIRKLRQTECQAARDLYLAYKYLQAETGRSVVSETRFQRWGTLIKEFVTVRRNWRAAQSAYFCMFMQQFCGVNVLAYYSTSIFTNAGFTRSEALAVSLGCGVINFLGAAPALWAIDRKGRRTLLLVTFPLLALFLIMASLTFRLTAGKMRLGLVGASLYLFMMAYSPGMGPVPFTYSAEAFPLHFRAQGMASAVSITWTFNFLISFTWPAMSEAMTPSGGLAWYAAWNIFGWVFTYFLLPETKGHSLEELDNVFSVRNRDHVVFHWRKLGNRCKQVLGIDVEPVEPLYGDKVVNGSGIVCTTEITIEEAEVVRGKGLEQTGVGTSALCEPSPQPKSDPGV